MLGLRQTAGIFRQTLTHQRPSFAPAAARSALYATALRTRSLSTDARKLIDSAVQTHPLVVFMKGTPELPMCGFSRAVVQVLEVQGVKPEALKTFNCLEDQELREGIKEYSDWPTIPQVYVGGDFVGGCDIMLSMHQSGELEELLLKHDLLLPVQPESS